MKKIRKRKLLIDVQLPNKGQCTYYNDDWTLCTKRISNGSFCAYHAKVCYVGIFPVDRFIRDAQFFSGALPEVGVSDLFKGKNGGKE